MHLINVAPSQPESYIAHTVKRESFLSAVQNDSDDDDDGCDPATLTETEGEATPVKDHLCREVSNLESASRPARVRTNTHLPAECAGSGGGGKNGGRAMSCKELRTLHSLAPTNMHARSRSISRNPNHWKTVMTKFVTESMGEKSPEAGESLNQFHELLTTPLARRPLSQHFHG